MINCIALSSSVAVNSILMIAVILLLKPHPEMLSGAQWHVLTAMDKIVRGLRVISGTDFVTIAHQISTSTVMCLVWMTVIVYQFEDYWPKMILVVVITQFLFMVCPLMIRWSLIKSTT